MQHHEPASTAPGNAPSQPPPFGSWARLYLLVVALAVLMLIVLWWFTATYNIRL